MTIIEQHSMAEYTKQLEERLESKEHEFAAAMTTTQENVMEQMQTQQKAMMDQNQKMMEMMMTKLGKMNTNNNNGNNNNGNNNNNNRGDSPFPTCPHCGKKGKHALKPESCKVYIDKQKGE